jgi:hypothetical protein
MPANAPPNWKRKLWYIFFNSISIFELILIFRISVEQHLGKQGGGSQKNNVHGKKILEINF